MEYELKFWTDDEDRFRHISSLAEYSLISQSDYPCNNVHSLYFTNDLDEFIEQKIESEFYKKKFRLRWYDNSEIFWESKERFGEKRAKSRSKVDLNINEIIQNRPFIYKNLQAIIGVSYKRRRFIDPVLNCRVNIDSDLKITYFDKTRLPQPIFSNELNKFVIEAKCSNKIIALNTLKKFDIDYANSFSKSVYAIQLLKHNQLSRNKNAVYGLLSSDGY